MNEPTDAIKPGLWGVGFRQPFARPLKAAEGGHAVPDARTSGLDRQVCCA